MTPELPIEDGAGMPEILPPAYDVCNPDRLPAERVAFVDGILQQFLQTFGELLTVYLDMPVEGIPAGVDQLPVANFLEASANDACIVTLDLAPMRGHAWVGISTGFLFRVLDILLGAPPAAAPAARNTITEIERHVLREFFHTLLTTLANAWKPSGISLTMASIDNAEEVCKTVDPDGTMLILNCRMKFQEAEETFRVAVPVLAVRLAALQNELSAAGQAAVETATRSSRLDVIGGATLQLEAILGGASIRLGDLAAMQSGQILVLTLPAGTQLDCLVNGKAKFRGDWIVDGDRRALQVDALV